MRTLFITLFTTCCFIAFTFQVKAQKMIVISDNLSSSSQMMPVKMGSQKFGKIWNFRFGDYAVVSSKQGWTITKSKSNFWGTKSASKTSDKFSFVLCNKASDSAVVNATNKIEVQTLNEIELFPNFTWGENELVKGGSIFSAYITINHDTADVWAVFINKVEGSQTDSQFLAFLTNGYRDIKIYPTTSDANSPKASMFPARGYEFVEKDQSLSALQYLGSGVLGTNKNIIWMGNMNDERMKLILASAMTAILQLETTHSDRMMAN